SHAPSNGKCYRYIRISREVCHPNNPSSHKYDDYTNLNGSPLLGLRMAMVFSLGLPQAHPNNTFLRGNYSVVLRSNGGQYLNPKEQRRISKEFEKEMSTYDDIIVGDFEDTYLNLTFKSYYSFLWVSTFCRKRRPTVIFIDDDVPISLEYFARVLRIQRRRHNNAFFHGVIKLNDIVLRFDGKSIPRWNALKSEVPWPIYPMYIHGPLLLASFEHVENMALGMAFTKFFPTDDTWIGLVAAKLGISFHHINELLHWNKILTHRPHNATSMKPIAFR
ncbi:unnamed protein product, partial [Hymenolepis diminuta]|uniref:Hexosyltransferase n=1 Tax=Hymenolepis diminuta TaxID=6216 RepID=A0A0R3SZR1_HYMDI